MTLLAVPNLAAGGAGDGDRLAIEALRECIGEGVELLDTHSDPDHDRTVLTFAGEPAAIAEAAAALAAEAVERIDMRGWGGMHPCVGALDVCPVVWLDRADRQAAARVATATAERIAGLGVPVFLYGELAVEERRRERAYFRAGGLPELTRRMASGELSPDFGPPAPHPSAGATLVGARPPLAAFNVELDRGGAEVAAAVAARLRESGGGIAGVRAIGLELSDGTTQVSTNVHDPIGTPLGLVVEAVRELAAGHGARPVAAELVGLIPEAALAGYPREVPIRGFEPDRRVIERLLGPTGTRQGEPDR